MSKYPNQIDDNTSLPPASGSDANSINSNISATEAIETELGILPAGAYATVRTRLDILEARINNPFAPAPTTLNPFFIGNTGVTIQAGFGDPNLIFAIPPVSGSLFIREDGYVEQGLYQFQDGYWHDFGTSNQLTTVHSVVTLANSGGNYTLQSEDNFIPCDSTGGSFSITLPLIPTVGQSYTIADISGQANNHPITVFGNGKQITGLSSYVLTISYESITLLYNGINWSII